MRPPEAAQPRTPAPRSWPKARGPQGSAPVTREGFNPAEHLEELALHGVTEHSFIDGIAPVFFDARPVTCSFLDQFSILSQNGSRRGDESLSATADLDDVPAFIKMRMAFLELARYLYGHFGVFTAYMRYPEFSGSRCHPLAKVFFSKDASLIEKVAAPESAIWEEMASSNATTQIRSQSLVQEGKLLGYPDCCVEWATQMRSQQDSYERHAIHALLEQEDALETGSIELRPDPAYFAFEFYPCDPKCKAAVDQGLDIWKSYQAVSGELASLYRDYALRLNKARIVSSAESYADMMIQFHSWLDDQAENCRDSK